VQMSSNIEQNLKDLAAEVEISIFLFFSSTNSL